MIPKDGFDLMRYCGHFLIKTEGGANNYKRDHPLLLTWPSFTVTFVQQKGYTHTHIYIYMYIPHKLEFVHP